MGFWAYLKGTDIREIYNKTKNKGNLILNYGGRYCGIAMALDAGWNLVYYSYTGMMEGLAAIIIGMYSSYSCTKEIINLKKINNLESQADDLVNHILPKSEVSKSIIKNKKKSSGISGGRGGA